MRKRFGRPARTSSFAGPHIASPATLSYNDNDAGAVHTDNDIDNDADNDSDTDNDSDSDNDSDIDTDNADDANLETDGERNDSRLQSGE